MPDIIENLLKNYDFKLITVCTITSCDSQLAKHETCGSGPQVEPKPTRSVKNLLIVLYTTPSVAAQLMSRDCI